MSVSIVKAQDGLRLVALPGIWRDAIHSKDW